MTPIYADLSALDILPSSNRMPMEIKGEHREDILAVFAHELRQPLTSILFAVQCATVVPPNETIIREMVEMIERQSHYLVRLIDEALEDCRSRQAKHSIHKDWFELDRIIEEAIEAAYAVIATREHRLSISLPQERLWVHADALRLQQIVINLLTNAAKYTAPGGSIRLSAEKHDGLIIIEVSDNGIGIAEEMLPRVFDLFCQADEHSRSEAAGCGIGLALVKSFVELHGGTVGVQSGGIGKGSTFAAHLPCPTLCKHQGSTGSGLSARRATTIRSFQTGPMSDA